MKFMEYIASHQVFTTAQLMSTIASRSSAKSLLSRAVSSGKIENVRRGLYVSKTGKFTGENADPFAIIATLDSSAILSFHSALEAHGVAHTVAATCQFRSSSIKSKFIYSNIEYLPYPIKGAVETQRLRGKAFESVKLTTREQTVIDCLKYPERCGGIEEVVRSLAALPYIDQQALAKLLKKQSIAVKSRVGWLLDAQRDDWHVDESMLDNLEAEIGAGPVRLDKKSGTAKGWVRRWNLLLPEPEEEVTSWLN